MNQKIKKIVMWSMLYLGLIILAIYSSHDPSQPEQKAKTIFQYQQF